MLRDAEHGNDLNQTTLFYSNRRPADAAMLAELQALEIANPGFTLIASMTGLEDGHAWRGETGYIDAAMLARHLADMKTPTYFCVGPGTFVSPMENMLKAADVEGEKI